MSGYDIVKLIVDRSDELSDAFEQMPEEQQELYSEMTQSLHVEMSLLSTAVDEGQKEFHQDNIKHIKSALASLDAVTGINTYRTTVSLIGSILKTAITIALTL